MNRRLLSAAACVLALAASRPATAAWAPLQPGWNVHEVPLPFTWVANGHDPNPIALDPLTGDVFLVASLDEAVAAFHLYRVTTTAAIQDLGLATEPIGRILFDAVHREVLLAQDGAITRDGLVWRVDAAATAAIGSSLLNGPLAAGEGMVLLRNVALDATAGAAGAAGPGRPTDRCRGLVAFPS